jgi:1-carboxybiuret hydrolase subunit AtzG-like
VIRKEDVLGFAEMVGLSIEEKRIQSVLANLQRMEEVAALVNAVELGPEDELGPEWRP